MLYERWTEVIKSRPNEVALRHPGIPNGWTFNEMDQRACALPAPASEYVTAYGDDLGFFPTILSAWKHGVPVLVLESQSIRPMPIRTAIPKGTVLIKQTCGASGLERSLFFGGPQVIAEGQRNITALGLAPECRSIGAISLAHSYGFGCLALPLLLAGVPLDVLTSPLPAFVQQALEQDGQYFLPGVPALWKTWWQTRTLNSPSICLALSAGAPLSHELESGIRQDTGVKLHNFYGTTETGAIAFNASEEPRGDASLIGGILPGVDVRISADNRILVQSDAAAIGADQTISDDEFSQTYYRTMDLGRVQDGRLFWDDHVGRAINVAGRKVSPERIKRACQLHPSVSGIEVSCVRSRDFERFEEVKVSLCLDASCDLKSLKEFVHNKLDSWEVPRQWNITQS